MADFSQRLLGAGAEAQNDWARASASTAVVFTGTGQVRRGIELEIGIGALATADAGLSKFIAATARGNAFAEAKASLRLQLPLNLFKDFGLTVGAEAVAQAAAGIEVGLGLAIGDFVALLASNEDSLGLPLDLVIILLDEAEIGGHFEVHVAAAAMAYASVLITGEIVTKPGFHVTADAGLGLAAGVGFSGGLDLGIRDFRKFYGRAVDRTIASVVDGITTLLSADAPELAPVVRALAPVASTALRVAYEIGDFIAKNDPGYDHQAALSLSNHCVGILLEEAQRFLFDQFVAAGFRRLERLVTSDVPNLSAGLWDRLMPQRQALADVLYRTPAEPYQPTDENAAYWADLVASALALVEQLPSAPSDGAVQAMAMMFAGSELLAEAIRSRVNRAQAYAFAIGAGQATTPPPPFGGALVHQPAPPIAAHIRQVLGSSASHPLLDYGDLAAYLIADPVTTALRAAIPEIDEYLGIFRTPQVGSGLTDVLRAFLKHRDAFVTDAHGQRDPHETLRVLLGALDTFITDRINRDLVPAVNQRIGDPNVKTYFDEVIVGTLLFVKEVAFQTVLDWEKVRVDKSAFTEALAGVITMLLGRSLVLVGDGFLSAMQGDMQRACTHAANSLDGQKDPLTALGIPVSPDMKALLAETLRIGGEVFGPLPGSVRRRLRFALYDVMETLPPDAAARADIVTNLRDQFFIPNQDSLDALSDVLLEISRDRFQLFVERVLERAGALLLDAIEDLLAEVAAAIEQWVNQIEATITDLANRLTELVHEISAFIADVRAAFNDALDDVEALLGTFSAQNLRSRLRDDLADRFYDGARDLLNDDPIYRNLPREGRRAVRRALRDLIDDLIGSPIVDVLLDAVGGVAGELDGLLEDVRDLNPNEPLAPQLLDLAIDRMEDSIRTAFGGSNPRIDVGFTVSVFGFSTHFSLGRVVLPFSAVFQVLRGAVDDLTFYRAALNTAAASLAHAFELSVNLDARQTERDAKRSERDRLRQIREEYTGDPKTIAVVNPVQAVTYDGDVDVTIHLGGVPRSYLGLNPDEYPRVLVLLNGDLVPPQLFAVEVSSTPAPQAIAGGAVAAGASSRPGPPVLGGLAGGRAARSPLPMAKQSVVAGAKGKGIVTSAAVVNVLPGRRMTPTKQATLQQTLPPGTTLRFTATRDRLVAGANTLVVAVLDPGGQRYQQVVSFSVSAASKGSSVVGPRLPVRPGRLPAGTPQSPASHINVHFDRGALASRIAASRTLLNHLAPNRVAPAPPAPIP